MELIWLTEIEINLLISILSADFRHMQFLYVQHTHTHTNTHTHKNTSTQTEEFRS